MKYFMGPDCAILAILIIMFMLPAITDNGWSDKDMRQACAKHGGVRSFESNTLATAATQEKAVVICIDGYVTKDQT